MRNCCEIDVEARIERGVEYFMSGYNCCQSVVAAFADIYDLSPDLALAVSSSFGAGMGRLRLTCGTVSGMSILAGLENGYCDPKDLKARGENYATVQALANRFKETNGSIICAELLGLRKNIKESTMPSERTAQYYASRPCAAMVASACRIYAEYLINKK